MRCARLWVISFTFVVGCGGSNGDPPLGVAGEGSSNGGSSGAAPLGGAAGTVASSGNSQGGSSGTAPTGGVAGALGNAGSAGRPPSGGSAGSSSSNGGTGGNSGGSGASTSMGGRTGGGPSTGGTSSAGRGNGSTGGLGGGGRGSGGRSGGASSTGGVPSNAGNSGAPATGGTGGTGSCVKNLGCKLQAPPSTGDLHQDCVDRINQFRTQCACLPALQRGTAGEACADQMAEYDASKGTAHAGHSDKICEPTGAQNSCPGYSSNNQVISLCLQQMWDEGPPPMTPCNGECFQTYGHFINMTTTSSTKVSCGFFTTSAGKVWAVQNFTR